MTKTHDEDGNPVRRFVIHYHQTTIYIAVVVTVLLILELLQAART